MTSSVALLTSLLLVATASRDDAVEYRLLEESEAGTRVGELRRDVPGLTGDQLRFSIVTSSSAARGRLSSLSYIFYAVRVELCEEETKTKREYDKV